MVLALSATVIVIVALLWEVATPRVREWRDAPAREPRACVPTAPASRATTPAASAAPSSAPASSCARASTRRSGRCTATWASSGSGADSPAARSAAAASKTRDGAPYAYLIYPHKPIVAYLPQTRELLCEYCVEFPDETRPFGSARLPDSDDVLAKWMALTGDERRLIGEANMHLPGRQVDPKVVRRDLWRLGEWERDRVRKAERAGRSERTARLKPFTRFPGAMSATDTAFDVKHRSRALTEGPHRAAARAYLKGIGFTDEDLAKPIIGVASTWIETMPCNFHLRALAAKVKDGIRAAGATPMELNTIAISDGITMGTSGMKTSLVSREVIADSIELVSRGHLFDAVIALSGCDKTIPGAVMALARLDVPSVMLYGGSIRPGTLPRQGRHHPGRLRGRRRARHGQDDRRGPARARERRQPRGRRLRRAVHRQHDGDGLRGHGHQPDGLGDGPGRVRARRPTSPSRPASSSSTCSSAASTRARSSRRTRSRTRSRRSPAAAARPTASCTSSPSPARRASS